jgi:hypothetical protein
MPSVSMPRVLGCSLWPRVVIALIDKRRTKSVGAGFPCLLAAPEL